MYTLRCTRSVPDTFAQPPYTLGHFQVARQRDRCRRRPQKWPYLSCSSLGFLALFLAAQHFETARQLDRCRVEDMEVYSTVLWHTKRDYELSHLAQEMAATDRLAPQVG